MGSECQHSTPPPVRPPAPPSPHPRTAANPDSDRNLCGLPPAPRQRVRRAAHAQRQLPVALHSAPATFRISEPEGARVAPRTGAQPGGP